MSTFEPLERVQLFKKYALELVVAAAQSLRQNEIVMDGGSECISGINRRENLNAIDAILAIMSLAKNHHYELQLMRFADVSHVEIKDELVEHIRRILVVIERSSLYFKNKRVREYFAPYMSKYERRLSGAEPESSEYNEIIQSGIKCYQTKESFYLDRNKKFFEQLAAGFYIVRVLMRSDDDNWENDARQIELKSIIGSISRFQLRHPIQNVSMDEFVSHLQTMAMIN